MTSDDEERINIHSFIELLKNTNIYSVFYFIIIKLYF